MTVPLAQQYYRWNFLLWVVETSLWMLATALIDSTTVLPVLVLALSGSPFLASLILSLRYAGQSLPQLISASLVSGKPWRKRYYLLFVIPGRLLLLWPAIVLLLGYRAPQVTIPAILVAFLGFWISEGFSLVPWVDMLGKTIPPGRRGRLFAAMHVVGGIMGVGAGFFIRELLQRREAAFPTGYGVLFFLSLATIALSTAALALLREPPSPPHEERYSTLALIKDIPNLLRSMPQFRLLILLQGLFGFAMLSAPLYILFATRALREATGAAGADSLGVGVFLAVQTTGMIVGNAVWGHLGDYYGNRLLLRALALGHAGTPVFALIAGAISRTDIPAWALYFTFAPSFFLLGGLFGGTWMGVTNFLLELAPEHDRPAYIAVMNALNIPAIILPMLGGLLVNVLGYNTIFSISAGVLIYAFWLTHKLVEPREILTHHHHPPPQPWQ